MNINNPPYLRTHSLVKNNLTIKITDTNAKNETLMVNTLPPYFNLYTLTLNIVCVLNL